MSAARRVSGDDHQAAGAGPHPRSAPAVRRRGPRRRRTAAPQRPRRGPLAAAAPAARRLALAWGLLAAAAGCAGRAPRPDETAAARGLPARSLPAADAATAGAPAAGGGAGNAADAAGAAAAAAGAGYEMRRESLAGRDLAPLRGRRIVLDPGHGGVFRGARGPNGLEEADVNLGVALYLRGLLEWAGAGVVLTRSADHDLLTPADSSAAADLRARVAIANAARPDVFLSLHHNSNAALDTTLNETLTYYPAGRDGADLDLARAVHRHLVANLEIAPARILPGNFHVLRHSRVPAVLGEPAMLSHPGAARRLSLAAKQRLEAEAYFLGLLDYFAGGSPRWRALGPDTLVAGPAGGPAARWRFDDGGEPGRPGPALDPATVALTLDGRRQTVELDAAGATVTWRPPRPWPTGDHRLALRGRNLQGRAAPVAAAVWRVLPVGERVTARLWTVDGAAGEPDGAAPSLLAWECRDQSGQLCRTSGRLRLVPAAGGAPVELPDWPGGRGWRLLPPRAAAGAVSLAWAGASVAGREPPAPLERRRLPAGSRFVALRAPAWPPGTAVPGGAWRARLGGPPPEADLPPSGPVFVAETGRPFWLEADGAAPLVGDAGHRGPWDDPASPPPDTLSWRPLRPELLGLTVVLDPAGGGPDTDGAGPLGTRGADLNLAVAEALAALLRGAGARAVLTREDERWLAPEAKLLLANETGADYYLTIGRGGGDDHRAASGDGVPVPAVFHSEGSRAGALWAAATARAAAPLLRGAPAAGRANAAPPAASDAVAPATAPAVVPAAEYLLRQTACPALRVALGALRDAETERRLLSPARQQAEARALFLGLVAAVAGPAALEEALDPAAWFAAAPEALPPLADVTWAQVDGNWPWLPPVWSPAPGRDASWQEAPGLPARGGEHTLEVRTARDWRLVGLRREAGGRWRARVLFTGPAAGAAGPTP